MAQQWNFRRDRAGWAGAIAGAFLTFYPTTATAQIAGDGTLGTQVNGALTAPCTGTCIITNGAIRGSNLFHSLRQFSLPNGGDFAGFVTTPAIQNVIVRVTGVGQPFISNINGTIATINAAGTAINPANFFLLNPNGIIFGSNASLLIGGSFLATTANRMQFADGTDFRTNDPAPLLTVNVPVGLQFNAAPGSIQMQGSFLSAGNMDSFSDFALIGGDVTLDNSFVRSPGRRVELRGVGENGTVGLRLIGDRLSSSLPADTPRRDITLTNRSNVNTVASIGSGALVVTGRNILLSGGSIMATGILPGADNAATNQAGDITIDATANLELSQGSFIANVVLPNAIGQGGNISITASDIQVRDDGSLIDAITFGNGNAGNVIVQTGSLAITNSANVSARTSGNGNAGNVQVTANTIALDGASFIDSQVSLTGSGHAGDVMIQTGALTLTNGSTVEASTAGNGNAGNVRVTANTIALDQGYISSAVGPTSIGRGGNVTVQTDALMATNESSVQATTLGNGEAGNVRVTARTIALDNISFIDSQVSLTGNGQGGNVTVETDSLAVTNGSSVSASTFGKGDSGNVKVTANAITLDGTTTNSFGQFASVIASQVGQTGIGKGGDTIIETGSLTVTNGAAVTANTFGNGDAGNVRVTAKTIVLDGNAPNNQFASGISSQVSDTGNGRGGDVTIQTGALTVTNGAVVSASTFGNGNAGNVRVTANTIALDGIPTDGQGSSGISSQVAPTVSGQGGNITVQTGSLNVTNGAQISVSTFGKGNAGNVRVVANTVALDGTAPDGQGASSIDSAVGSTGSGHGGDVSIETDSLTVSNRALISASTFGNGDAGSILVKANVVDASSGGQIRTSTASGSQAGAIVLNVSDRLTLSGTNTGLFANTAPGSSGNGGSIFIDPRTVTIQDGAKIAVDSQGSGTGGNISIQAGRLELRDHGAITAETASAQGGNITLDVKDLILMRRNSLISATAGTAQSGGDGGNITIRTPFIVGVLGENSDITANAFQGNGGNINITTNGIYGLKFQPKLTPFSDITASSQFGINGTVTLNILNVDPSRGLVALPVTLTDPSQQISQDCKPGSKTSASSFVSTGRGGIPLSPDEPLEGRAVVTKWVTLPEDVGEKRRAREGEGERGIEATHPPIHPSSLIEAQSIVVGTDGTVELVANHLTGDRANVWLEPAPCQVSHRH